jgi:hypothetical protein
MYINIRLKHLIFWNGGSNFIWDNQTSRKYLLFATFICYYNKYNYLYISQTKNVVLDFDFISFCKWK